MTPHFDKMRDYYNRVYPNLIEQLEREAYYHKEIEKSLRLSLSIKEIINGA
jgi:hypothetical protein